jgi:hypothetical protein
MCIEGKEGVEERREEKRKKQILIFLIFLSVFVLIFYW